MKKSALSYEAEDTSFVDPEPASKVIAFRSTDSVSFAETKEQPSRTRRRRKRLLRFIKLELSIFVFLVFLLVTATWEPFRTAGLTVPFEIAAVLAALAVAIIPIIFYGPTRQKYRYQARHYRAR